MGFTRKPRWDRAGGNRSPGQITAISRFHLAECNQPVFQIVLPEYNAGTGSGQNTNNSTGTGGKAFAGALAWRWHGKR
jgi:hypothetical protein